MRHARTTAWVWERRRHRCWPRALVRNLPRCGVLRSRDARSEQSPPSRPADHVHQSAGHLPNSSRTTTRAKGRSRDARRCPGDLQPSRSFAREPPIKLRRDRDRDRVHDATKPTLALLAASKLTLRVEGTSCGHCHGASNAKAGNHGMGHGSKRAHNSRNIGVRIHTQTVFGEPKLTDPSMSDCLPRRRRRANIAGGPS